jgi:hypothetical protein
MTFFFVIFHNNVISYHSVDTYELKDIRAMYKS